MRNTFGDNKLDFDFSASTAALPPTSM